MVNLPQVDPNGAPLLSMQDDLGIVYLIDSAQQFWSGKRLVGGGTWRKYADLWLQSSETPLRYLNTSHQPCRSWILRYGDS